jgi:hypothetical protein
MRCKFFIPIFLLLLCVSGVYAMMMPPQMPYVIYGKVMVNGKPLAFQKMIFVNRRSGDVAFAETNKVGDYTFTASNFAGGFKNFDMVKIDACDGSDKCIVYAQINNDYGVKTMVNVNVFDDNLVVYYVAGAVLLAGVGVGGYYLLKKKDTKVKKKKKR